MNQINVLRTIGYLRTVREFVFEMKVLQASRYLRVPPRTAAYWQVILLMNV